MENTDKQHIEKLRAYWDEHQAFPSMAKLREVVGLNSTASVFEMIGRLVDAGHLQRVARRIAPTKAFLALPVEQAASGKSEAPTPVGSPSAVNLLDYVMPDRKGAFLITVTDDQLAPRDVHKGDLLLMNESEPAKAGDIVARRANERVWLSLVNSASPKNLVLEPLYAATSDLCPPAAAKRADIVGVAVALVRRFDR